MSKFKLVASAVLLSTVFASAHAAVLVSDSELSDIRGQDGVTIAGDLNINIGAFKWTDTDLNGGSVSFNNIAITGMFVTTIDVLDAETIVTATINSMKKYVSPAEAIRQANRLITQGVYDGETDVVQFAFPNAGLDSKLSPSIKIASITMGNSTKSFGSLAIDHIDMQGTKIWLWAH